MADAHYELPELAELYDVDSPWSADRDFYLNLAGETPRRVLEVGCGTGLVARAMALEGHQVTGVDPATAMLDVGRRSHGGDRMSWIKASAQDFELPDHFDLAFMTGHAFQVLLEDAEIAASLANISRHLLSGGIFAFETRNPALPWETMFPKTSTLRTEKGDVKATWKVHWRANDEIRFDTIYQLGDGVRISESRLRFTSLDQIKSFLFGAGMSIKSVHGDWDGSPFDPATSPEIIVIASRDH